MTKYKGRTITYDAIGNPTNYYNGAWWTMTWEHGRQLATITQTSTSTTWTNTYNSDGLRTSRTDGTTTYTYYYEGGRLSAIKRNDLNMWIIYDENGPVTLKYGVGTFHYVTNLQGDVVAIVGNQGQKLVEYTYDAWGKVLSITGDYAYNLGIHNPILYRGYIYDHETGLYYVSSRYYDPEIGRFINADTFTSTGQGMLGNNMFAYCRNNPICRVDIRGTEDAVAYNDGELLSSDDLEERAKGGGSSQSTNGPSATQVGAQTVNQASNPLRNITYTGKVLQQIQQGDYHSFPAVVDNYGSYGIQTTFIGGDGSSYQRLAIAGSYGNDNGHFVYIWDARNICNHRLFEVCK